ncbi:MAG: hypothetical protein JW981_02915 [Anaerolineae bacterium]|nr:hypothetical protein [Anaerolineae bacterium]
MPLPRDIALIFLCLQALVMGIVPLALVGGIAYGFYRLRGLAQTGLRYAFEYAELVREKVEQASYAVAKPFIQVNETFEMVTTISKKLFLRRKE